VNSSLDVPSDVLDKIDEVITDVIGGQGEIPLQLDASRYRYQSRLPCAEQHHVICDSSYIPMNQDMFNWTSASQTSDSYSSSLSHKSERVAVAELISSILSNGATSTI
jgi:hypothetical protein